ncbi:MAG: hypothetical protein LDL41_02420 [Coleofasciculus sp. S288]|nr:hypothetical protein [Coleofasciculus sp. S288]
MKLRELKQRVYEDWQRRCWYNQAVIQPETFKPEIRQYGDLRHKATWVKAFARFRALNLWDGCLDAYTLITQHFNFVEERWDYEFRFQILEEFLSLPGALEALQTGWEQLFGSDLTTPQEKETAYGLLAMVSRQSEGTRRTAAGTRLGEHLQLQLATSSQARTS